MVREHAVAGRLALIAAEKESDVERLPPGLRTRALDESAGTLPLVVEPATRAQAGGASLSALLGAHRPWMQERLLRHGAVLFRGFDVAGAPSFERVARAVEPELKNDYLGTSPRDALTSHVFSASELPPFYPIPQHCEMSFTRAPPSRLFFCALRPNDGPGGETPLVDFRRVLADLDPVVRERFLARGVRNVRNYVGPEGGGRFDLWKLKRWDEMFRTTDRTVVEQRCREQGFEHTWLPGGRLRLVNVQPAARPHPLTGEPTWYNHAQVFHLSAAPAEYARIAARQRTLKMALLRRVAEALVFVKRRSTPPDAQAMHCTYGDGSPISDADMDAVRDAIWKNLVAFSWRRGDVLALDNFAISHGRLPYAGPRTVAVAWA